MAKQVETGTQIKATPKSTPHASVANLAPPPLYQGIPPSNGSIVTRALEKYKFLSCKLGHCHLTRLLDSHSTHTTETRKEWIEGKGLGLGVPKHLRCDNRLLSDLFIEARFINFARSGSRENCVTNISRSSMSLSSFTIFGIANPEVMPRMCVWAKRKLFRYVFLPMRLVSIYLIICCIWKTSFQTFSLCI